MTTYDYGADAPTQTGGAGASGGAKDQAKHAARTAADEGAHLAEAAKSEAQSVATDAKEQARNLVDEARVQVQEQSRSQLDTLVSTLQSFAEDLERMARGEGAGSGLAHDVVTQVGEKARTISSQLRGQEPAQVLDQARDFARRRPGTFLLGALAAGVVAGRVARGAKDAQDSPAAGASTTPPTTEFASPPAPPPPAAPGYSMPPSAPPVTAGGTAADDPLAGTDTPAEPPVYPAGGSTPGGTL
ncbi:hypothetical protein [Nocardioides bizhenqiangii]|uniref:ATP synthase F0 subunit B n=1 Tax=Nocardioides bizhenqiangii TaxID=3095076 RepID=A0ABZ0ZN84_9ACTN|nr:hypothetical protein [Nocardioides sp. HM61]WQQ25745.1 hypothetical protein SHK19_17480 [Nocardioides sp. HM61]